MSLCFVPGHLPVCPNMKTVRLQRLVDVAGREILGLDVDQLEVVAVRVAWPAGASFPANWLNVTTSRRICRRAECRFLPGDKILETVDESSRESRRFVPALLFAGQTDVAVVRETGKEILLPAATSKLINWPIEL